MPGYRRNYEGRIFFFTLVTRQRRPIFADNAAREALGNILRQTASERPWKTEAMVLMPEHLHLLWLMPEDDSDYSTRISVVKRRFTRWYLASGRKEVGVSTGQRRHRLRGVWQRRFWEHTIRDAADYQRHMDYIHANPVKHGLAEKPLDWQWSTFRRYVDEGVYEDDWCGRIELPGQVEFWSE